MTPEGWAEELATQEAGFDEAVAVLQKKQRRTSPQPPQGKPVYGMPGVRMQDSRPDLRPAAQAEYPELR